MIAPWANLDALKTNVGREIVPGAIRIYALRRLSRSRTQDEPWLRLVSQSIFWRCQFRSRTQNYLTTECHAAETDYRPACILYLLPENRYRGNHAPLWTAMVKKSLTFKGSMN